MKIGMSNWARPFASVWRVIVFTLVVCATTSAWAVDPVAVWDGDFTASRTGFSLQRNGNAISQDNSTITIDQSVGVNVDFSTGIGAMTVMFKYSSLTFDAQKTLATSFVSGADENRTGVYLDSDGTAKGIANTGNWNNPVGSLSESSGVLAFTYSGTGGTALYYISSLGVRTQVYYKTNLRWSSDTSINGCTIGGERAKGTTSLLGAATGMKITGIAIFNGTLTESDMTSYVWPSSYTQASATVSEDTSLSSILSAAGITTETRNTTALTITATDNPTITIDDIVTLGCLTINGAATIKVSPSLYDEGCFKKSVVYAHGWISAAGATLVAKYGSWKGVFQNTRKELVLCAQDAETISINIGGGSSGTESPAANLVTGSDYYGLYPTPGDAWNNISGRWSGGSRTVTLTSAKAFDGETTTTRATVQLSGTANNTYQWTGTSVPYLRGYLDDTGGVQVKIVGVPYSEYDVIIYATSDSSLKLNYFTINEVNYTCGNDGVATEGTTSWGTGQTTTPTFGKNAMLVQGVTGSTLIVSGARAANSGPRVTVCAVQIINKGVVEASDWSANLNSTTSFTGGNGAGLSDQSGTWVNGSLASLTITNQANNATLTLDGTITAGTLKIVGAEGKNLTLAKDPGATLDITVYDLTEAEEETTFLFDPDFSKVNSGSNLIGVGFDYTGAIASGRHYIGSANVLTLSEVGSGVVNIGGSGTITGGLGISGDATVTFSGNYTSSGDTMLGATKGVLNIAEGAAIEVPHVRLVNSSSSVACTMNVDGELTVSSVSTSSNVYGDRLSYKGILFGHYYGSSTVNVGGTGSIAGNSAWMQLTYTAPNTMTVNGGTVKVRGINGGTYSSGNSSLTLTGGGTIEIAEGFVNMGHITRDYGYGTIKTYSYGNSTGWSDPGDITFSDSASGTTIDPCGMDNVFSGALSGSGKIIVNDSVGGGSVSFTGSSNNLTGNIFVSGTGNGVVLTLTPTEVTSSSNITVGSGGTLKIKVTEAEILHGYDASSKVSNSGGTVMFVDSSGTQITENVSQDGETLNPSVKIWRDGTWAEAVASGDDATLYISQNSTLNVSEALSLGIVTVVKESAGNVTLTISGVGALTTGGWTIPAGVTVVTADGMEIAGDVTGGGVINVPANTTLTMDGVTTPGDALADRVKVTVSGTLKTKGTTTLSAANTSATGSLIEVVAGTTTLSSAWQGIAGDITVDNEATLSFWDSFWDSVSGVQNFYYNHINPDGSSTIDVSGKIVLGSSRFLNFGAGIAVVMHSGSSITGARTDYGSLGWTGNCSLTVDGDATISAPIRINTGVSPTFTIQNNATLTIDKAFISSDSSFGTSGGSITKDGAGTLCLKDIEWTKPISGSEGTVEVNTAGRTNDRVNHSVSGASFSGTLKVVTPSGKAAYFDQNPASQLTGNPTLRLECGTQESPGSFYLGDSAIGHTLSAKNLSGWGIMTPWFGVDGTATFNIEQTDDTEFFGTFIDWQSTSKKLGLTVSGGSTVKSLTLSGENTTSGPLAIQNNAKVVFSGSGSWLNGTTTVKSGGVLESQRDAQVIGALALEDGSTLSFAEGYSLQVGAITLPASGTVTLDVSKLTLSDSGTTLMTFSTDAPSASDVVNKMTVSGAALKLENSTLKAYPVATVTDSVSGDVVPYPSVQDAIDNARAENNQYVTAYQSETVTAAGQILLKIADGAVVTLNSSKAGCAYDSGTHIVDGIYVFSDNVPVAATFKWKPAVASGLWGNTDNWTSDDGTVSRMPGSLDTVIFESDAMVETPTSGFSFAALQANASVTIKRDKWAIDDRLTRTVSAYGAISGTGSLTLNDGVNLANASGASLSIGVPVAVAGATALTVAEGVSASFTGSGTLTLDALTSTSIVGDDWTGTVVLPADALSSPLNFNLYGNSESVVQITGAVSGHLPDAEIVTTVKIPDSASLTLTGFSPSRANTFAKIEGEGTLSVPVEATDVNDLGNAANWGDGYNYSAYLLIKDVSKFTGSLTANQAAGIAIGATKPHKNTVGGKIIVSSGKTATVGASSTWTAGTVEVNGNVSVASGGALSGTIAGSGTVSFATIPSSALTFGENWTGTIELPSYSLNGEKFNNYGNSNSKVRINGYSGWLGWTQTGNPNKSRHNPTLDIAGSFAITAWSQYDYTFDKVTGSGSMTFSSGAPNSITITELEVPEGFNGVCVTNNTSKALTIGTLTLPSLPTCDQKILSVGGTGSISLDISNIKVGESPLPAKYKVERRPEGEEGDGFYVYYNGTIFSVW